MLPPERRLGRVLELIEDRKYGTLHSGRQTGKTTSAFWLVDHLNASERFRAAWIDLQTTREQPDLARAFPVILGELDRGFARDLPSLTRPASDEVKALLEVPERALHGYLKIVAARSDRPLVLLFDEADGLVGPAMVSFLTQLRAGYLDRSREPFPSSVVLIGLRPVRDDALAEAGGRAVSWLGTTSPFNLSTEAATLGPFTRDEVAELLAQHTQATGQRFADAAVDHLFALGAGHPWLTNAMADQIVARDVTDRAIEVTAAHVEAAKETITMVGLPRTVGTPPAAPVRGRLACQLSAASARAAAARVLNSLERWGQPWPATSGSVPSAVLPLGSWTGR
jgi:hypothetical protein